MDERNPILDLGPMVLAILDEYHEALKNEDFMMAFGWADELGRLGQSLTNLSLTLDESVNVATENWMANICTFSHN